MRLKVIEGGGDAAAEARVRESDDCVEAWLEAADPALLVGLGTRLAGLTSASRTRVLAELEPLAAAGLLSEADVLAAISPSTRAGLAIAACRLADALTDADGAAARLQRVLADASCARVRLHAATALARVGGAAARGALAEALMRDDDEEVRARAARGLGQLRDHRALPMLAAALANRGETPVVRGEAAEALGLIGRRSATPLLVRAARDSEPDVRAGAAIGLGMIGGPDVVVVLRALAEDRAMTSELGPVCDCAGAAIADIRRRAMLTG